MGQAVTLLAVIPVILQTYLVWWVLLGMFLTLAALFYKYEVKPLIDPDMDRDNEDD